MSTADLPEPAAPTSYPRGVHPDAARLERVRRAGERWLARPWPATPTSSLTGGGAIAALEEELAAVVDPSGEASALLLPSATYALRLALEALGVGPGDEVVLPVLDWPASYAAVLSLGARPVLTAVDPGTLTLDVEAAARARTRRTKAAVVCHLHGVPGDRAALREALDLPVVEDCAGALGSMLDGSHVGADLGVFSLGPNKQLDCFEGGVLVTRDRALLDRAVMRSAHPLRQLLSGLDPDTVASDAFAMRPHPMTAILGLDLLAAWDGPAARAAHRRAADTAGHDAVAVLGVDGRRSNAAGEVPVLVADPGAGGARSGARVLPCADRPDLADRAGALLARTRLVPVRG